MLKTVNNKMMTYIKWIAKNTIINMYHIKGLKDMINQPRIHLNMILKKRSLQKTVLLLKETKQIGQEKEISCLP